MEEKLNQIIELIQGLDVKIQNLDIKVEEKYQELNIKIDEGYQELNAKIEKKYQELDAKIEKKNQDLINNISFEFRQVTDVVYYAMDRKDNRLKEKIKEALHTKDEQE